MGLADQLAAQEEAFALEDRFDFLQVVQAPHDLGPLPGLLFLGETLLQSPPE